MTFSLNKILHTQPSGPLCATCGILLQRDVTYDTFSCPHCQYRVAATVYYQKRQLEEQLIKDMQNWQYLQKEYTFSVTPSQILTETTIKRETPLDWLNSELDKILALAR